MSRQRQRRRRPEPSGSRHLHLPGNSKRGQSPHGAGGLCGAEPTLTRPFHLAGISPECGAEDVLEYTAVQDAFPPWHVFSCLGVFAM